MTFTEALAESPILFKADSPITFEELYMRVNGEQFEVLYSNNGTDYVWIKLERITQQ